MKRAASGKQVADASGTHLCLVMMKAHRTLERLATHSIESSEVGLSDFAVLEMLLHKGPQPVNEIGRRIELTSGAITTAVDRLESRGLTTSEFPFCSGRSLDDDREVAPRSHAREFISAGVVAAVLIGAVFAVR